MSRSRWSRTRWSRTRSRPYNGHGGTITVPNGHGHRHGHGHGHGHGGKSVTCGVDDLEEARGPQNVIERVICGSYHVICVP
eukprot:453642-Rhodomonas_salina.1